MAMAQLMTDQRRCQQHAGWSLGYLLEQKFGQSHIQRAQPAVGLPLPEQLQQCGAVAQWVGNSIRAGVGDRVCDSLCGWPGNGLTKQIKLITDHALTSATG